MFKCRLNDVFFHELKSVLDGATFARRDDVRIVTFTVKMRKYLHCFQTQKATAIGEKVNNAIGTNVATKTIEEIKNQR
jgi:hypothetical protein